MGSAIKSFSLLALLVSPALSTILPRQSQSNTATVDLAATRGSPKHLASGFIYGIPDNPTQIPDKFYSDMGFNYARIGGAQLDAGGWIYGLHDYYVRFNNTRDNYRQARKFNAQVIVLPHDIWGTDHANSSTKWPGDNGDWSDYDKFLDQLFSDLKANDMLPGLVFDIWNEPDLPGVFWQRDQQRYLDLYIRTHKRLRSDPALNSVLVSGPSYSGQPRPDNSWYTNWLQRVVQENTIPDQYAWHDEPGDVQVDYPNWQNLLKTYNAPQRPININEYAVFDEQVSSGAAWWISRLERFDMIGLRGNWLSRCQLRDFMASLLTKSDPDTCGNDQYAPNGEYQVYKYYYQNMTGDRATTTSSGDGNLDLYSTIGCDKVRVLTGVHTGPSTTFITINNLSAAGLPKQGTLNIQTWGFEDRGHYGPVGSPSNRGVFGHQYSGDSVTFAVFQTQQDLHTAWGFEFAVGA